MVKQRSVRRKKRPKVFMTYKAISGSKSTSSLKKKAKAPTTLKKKLSLRTPVAPTVETTADTVVFGGQLKGLRLLDLGKVSAAIANNMLCNVCKMQTLTVQESFTGRRGLVTDIHVSCTNCAKRCSLSNPYDADTKSVNTRSVMAIRVAGSGLASLEKFCGIMGLPPPITDHAFMEHKSSILAAAVEESVESRRVAAQELHRLNDMSNDDILDITVTCDRTWAKRGFTSQFGVVMVISWESGQVLDYEVLSKYCHECKLHEPLDHSSAAYQDWWLGHKDKCSMNFEGSSASMECEGARIMWRRSEQDLQLRYTCLIADGDSKTHNALVEDDPYNGVSIVKHDCVGHVQKRMGSRLRKRRKEGCYSAAKKKMVSLGGKGRLTEAMIDSFQTYYGSAIRQNVGNLEEMRKAVLAIYHHSVSTDANPQHNYCPKGETSWCKYQQAVAKNRLNNSPTRRPFLQMLPKPSMAFS